MDVDQLMAEDGLEPEPLQVIAPLQDNQDLDVGEPVSGPVKELSNVEQSGSILVREEEHPVASPNVDEAEEAEQEESDDASGFCSNCGLS